MGTHHINQGVNLLWFLIRLRLIFLLQNLNYIIWFVGFWVPTSNGRFLSKIKIKKTNKLPNQWDRRRGVLLVQHRTHPTLMRVLCWVVYWWYFWSSYPWWRKEMWPPITLLNHRCRLGYLSLLRMEHNHKWIHRSIFRVTISQQRNRSLWDWILRGPCSGVSQWLCRSYDWLS